MRRYGALLAILFGLPACSDDSPSVPSDAGQVDAAVADAGTSDAGIAPADGGPSDAGPNDAGSDDAGLNDAGTDANIDGGIDAGPPPAPPCDATLIGPSCERQYILDGLVSMVAHDDLVYLGEASTVLRLNRVSGQVDVLSTAFDQSNLGAEVGEGPPISQVRFLSITGDGSTLHFYDDDAEAVFAVDTTTGDRSIVSDASNAFDGNMPVGTGPALNRINAMAWDPVGNRLLAANISNDTLIAVNVTSGDRNVVSSDANEGPNFQTTRSIAVDPDSGAIFVYEQNRASLYGVDRITGDRTVVSSDPGSTDGEVGTGVDLSGTRNVVFDPDSGNLYATNTDINGIIAIDPATGNRSVFSDPEPEAGAPVGTGSNLYYPFELALGDGELLVDDSHQEVLTAVDLTTGDRSVFLSSRLGDGYRFGNGPSNLVVDPATSTIYAWLDSDRKILAIDPATMERTVIVDRDDAGSGVPVSAIDGIALHGSSLYFLDDSADSLIRVDTGTLARTVISDDEDEHNGNAQVGTGPAFDGPKALAVDAANNRIFVADNRERSIVAVDLATGNRTVFSDNEDEFNGDAEVGTGPRFESIEHIALDSAGERLFVMDGGLNAIFAVDLSAGNLGNRSIFSDAEDSTAGGVEVGTGVAFGRPRDGIVDAANNRLLVVNSSPDGEEGLYAVDLDTGNRSVVSGITQGEGWLLDNPQGVALSGDHAYISDRTGNYMVRVSLAPETLGDRWVVASGATVDSY